MKNFLLMLPFFLAFWAIGSAEFSDIEESEYKYSINFLEEKNMLNGYSDGTFRPDETINRAEFVKILVGSQDIENPGRCRMASFVDAPMNEWFGPFVHEARCQNWVEGYSDGKFHPELNINYAEASKIMVSVLAKRFKTLMSGMKGLFERSKKQEPNPRPEILPSDILTRGEMSYMIEVFISKKTEETPLTPPVSYLNLTEAAAQELASSNGVSFRVGSEDGEIYMLTEDFVPGRVTVDLVAGVVVDFSIEGEASTDGGNNEPDPSDLESGRWHLVGYLNENTLIPVEDLRHERTVSFLEGDISARMDCNNSSGSYSVSADSLEIGVMASTMMECTDSIGEPSSSVVFDLLSQVGQYEVSKNEKVLVLKDSLGKELLTFLKSEATNILYTEEVTMEVGPETVSCYGVAPMDCLVVNGEFFYDTIAGFEHEVGFTYRLKVQKTKYCEPEIHNSCPSDVSPFRYELIEILSRTSL